MSWFGFVVNVILSELIFVFVELILKFKFSIVEFVLICGFLKVPLICELINIVPFLKL